MTGMVGKKSMKILVGGVPFGRDNVGDEAILECIVSIIRTICPDGEIWVSTDDRDATERKLNVKTVPLFGFDPPGFDVDEMYQAIDAVDAFVWAGATGLSDYPEIPMRQLQYAADNEKRTAIFCTGMNVELNPYLYKLLPGRRLKLYTVLQWCSFGTINFISSYQNRKKYRTSIKMRKCVESAGLVVLRDAPSLDAMRNLIGGPGVAVQIGADPAIEILPKPIASSRFSADVKEFCLRSERKIGLCVSAQSPVRELDELARLFDRLIDNNDVIIVGIPMNPVTDSRLMNDFRSRLAKPEAMCVAEGQYEPDEIAGLASMMNVVISSRLHLLILASITLTPFIGINRGSKVQNFCSQFDLADVGDVDQLDLSGLKAEVLRLLLEREKFEATAKTVRIDMLARLELAKAELSRLLHYD